MGNVERVMERVHRLLAIANDPAASDNEQHIALEQAQRLMNKHAIEEWQLEEDHDDVEIIERRIRLETNPCNRYMAQLANIVAHGNRCRAAYECRRAGNGRDVVSTVWIYGARVDVDKTESIWTAMETSRAAMWRERARTTPRAKANAAWRNGYYRGFQEEIARRYQILRREMESDGTGKELITVRGNQVDQWVEKTRHLQRQTAETLQAHGIQPVRLPARTTGRGTPGHRTQGDRQGRRLGSGKVERHLQNITHV